MYCKIADAVAGAGIELTDETIAALTIYLEELLRWNQHINLTAVEEPVSAIEKHIVDSLLIMKYLGEQKKMLDVGSGGGLPGLPLALAEPRLQIVSLDGSNKKINFQKHIRRKLRLSNFHPIHQRIERLPVSQENSYDLIVSRAFSSLERFVECSLPYLQEGGLWLAMKGLDGDKEAAQLQQSGLIKTLENVRVVNYNLPVSQAKRTVVLAIKRSVGERGCN